MKVPRKLLLALPFLVAALAEPLWPQLLDPFAADRLHRRTTGRDIAAAEQHDMPERGELPAGRKTQTAITSRHQHYFCSHSVLPCHLSIGRQQPNLLVFIGACKDKLVDDL